MPGSAIDLDNTPLSDEKNGDAEQDQIHQRKIPERSRRSDKTANMQRLHDRHGYKKKQQRDAETKKSGKARALPEQTKSFRRLLDHTKPQAIADRFELGRVTDHVVTIAVRLRKRRESVFLALLFLIEVFEAIILEVDEILVGAESLSWILHVIEQITVMFFALEYANPSVGG